MSAFLSDEALVSIFGEDLLAKESLFDDFKALLGETEQKPFECVGTVDEVQLAASLALLKRSKNTTFENTLPLFLAYYYEQKGKNIEQIEQEASRLSKTLLYRNEKSYQQLPELFRACIKD